MDSEKLAKIKRLNRSETEILNMLLIDPTTTVRQMAEEVHREESSVRGNLTAIFSKLGVPKGELNKRGWVVAEYSEAYDFIFNRGEVVAENHEKGSIELPVIHISPPDPIIEEDKGSVPLPVKEEATNKANDNPKPEVVVSNRQTQTTTSSGLGCGDVIGVLVFIALTSFLAFVIGSHAEHYNYGFLGEYFSDINWKIEGYNPSYPLDQLLNQFADHILLLDDFDNGRISSKWTIYGNYPIVKNGLVYPNKNELLGLSAGDNAGWANYIIYTKIVVLGCVTDEYPSRIGVRLNVPNVIYVYNWNSCEVPIGSTINSVITVQGKNYTVMVNGNKLGDGVIDTPGHEVGGMVIETNSGSAIDSLLVVKLP